MPLAAMKCFRPLVGPLKLSEAAPAVCLLGHLSTGVTLAIGRAYLDYLGGGWRVKE